METYISRLIILSLIIATSACGIKDKRTTMTAVDPNRHYYPVLQGQTLRLQYEIENTGKNPLFITDIQTSCGCVVTSKSSFEVLPAGGKGFIELQYNSNKNIGYVKHYVTLYANLQDTGQYVMTFDTYVVPDALYTKDYEELYRDYMKSHPDEKRLVEGRENELGYYVDKKK